LKTASATLTKSLAVLALGWCALAPVQAQTSASRIAWLSPERIYNESKLAKLAGEKLQEEFKSREKAMQDMAGRLKAASEKLEKDVPSLAEADRIKRQRDVFELDKEYQRRQREFREDLNQRTNEERQAISEKATDHQADGGGGRFRHRAAGRGLGQPAHRHHRQSAGRAG